MKLNLTLATFLELLAKEECSPSFKLLTEEVARLAFCPVNWKAIIKEIVQKHDIHDIVRSDRCFQKIAAIKELRQLVQDNKEFREALSEAGYPCLKGYSTIGLVDAKFLVESAHDSFGPFAPK